MIDSGASGMGFVDPAFAARCGAQLRPSSRRITLADGSEVRAAGEVTLTYSLAGAHVPRQGGHAAGALHVDVHRHAAGAARAHPGHGLAGAAPRADRIPRAQHPAARRRRGQAALHPSAGALQRRRQRGGGGRAAAAQGHRAEASAQADAPRAGRAAVRGAHRAAQPSTTQPTASEPSPGSEHPRVKALLDEFRSTCSASRSRACRASVAWSTPSSCMPGTCHRPHARCATRARRTLR